MTFAKIWRGMRSNPPWMWPWRLLEKCTSPVPPGLWLANVVMQRILRINGSIPWMVNFTSRVVGDVRIGANVWKSFALSGSCYIQGLNGVYINDDTLFAPGVKIISANHVLDNFDSWEKCDPIVIGKHCWIGANAVILPGVTLGDYVVVGAGAVVTKNVPDNTTVVGVPAKPIPRINKIP
jgi:hypothetical protein